MRICTNCGKTTSDWRIQLREPRRRCACGHMLCSHCFNIKDHQLHRQFKRVVLGPKVIVSRGRS